jgi:hypothetical protein
MSSLPEPRPTPNRLMNLKTIGTDIMRIIGNVNDSKGLVKDMLSSARLILQENGVQPQDFLNGGACVINNSYDAVNTPEQYIEGRRLFLAHSLDMAENAHLPDAQRVAAKLALLSNTLMELGMRLSGGQIGFYEAPNPLKDVVINPDGTTTPASAYIGPVVTFMSVGGIDLPDEHRFTLLPEHATVLSQAAATLAAATAPTATACGASEDAVVESRV